MYTIYMGCWFTRRPLKDKSCALEGKRDRLFSLGPSLLALRDLVSLRECAGGSGKGGKRSIE